MTTRREMIIAVSAGLVASAYRANGFAKKEFWDQKEPADWTDKEKKRLLTASPWAKEATVDFKMEQMNEGPGGGPPGGGPPGGGPPGGMPPGGGSGGGFPNMKAVVRWESAKPIQLAADKAPSDGPHDYVFSLQTPGGIPGGPGGSMPASMAPRAWLQCKGKPPVETVKTESVRQEGGAATLFVFPREVVAIGAEDKEVSFTAKMGPLEIKAKFLLKEMMYRGQVAL